MYTLADLPIHLGSKNAWLLQGLKISRLLRTLLIQQA